MDKDIRQLSSAIERKLKAISRHEACLIVDEVLEGYTNVIPEFGETEWASGRLINSGFGYVDGDLVQETDHGTNMNRTAVSTPAPPINFSGGNFHHEITIKYYTPKTTKKGKTFDYAPYYLDGRTGVSSFVRTERFRSRRASAVKGLTHNAIYIKKKIQIVIDRALSRGITRVGRDIVSALGSL